MPPLQPSAGRGAGALQPRARAWSAAGRRRGESRERRARRSGQELIWAGGQAQLRLSLRPSTLIGVRGLGPAGSPLGPSGSCFPGSWSFHPCTEFFGPIPPSPLLRVPGLPALPRPPVCPGWPLECAPGCMCRGGGRGMTACRKERWLDALCSARRDRGPRQGPGSPGQSSGTRSELASVSPFAYKTAALEAWGARPAAHREAQQAGRSLLSKAPGRSRGV